MIGEKIDAMPNRMLRICAFELRRDDVAALDVAGLVADDAGEFVVGLNEVDESLIDVDEAAHRREGVDLVVLDDLDRVRNVFARDLIPKVSGDALDVGVEERVGFDDAARDDLLVLGLPSAISACVDMAEDAAPGTAAKSREMIAKSGSVSRAESFLAYVAVSIRRRCVLYVDNVKNCESFVDGEGDCAALLLAEPYRDTLARKAGRP